MRTPKTHEIKIWPHYFEQIKSGNKTFEIRENDRNYQAGDTLVLNEWEPPHKVGKLGKYTGRKVTSIIGFVTTYMQAPDYVVFSLLEVKCKTSDAPR